MSHAAVAGSERFLVWLTSTHDNGDTFEWCVSHEISEESVAARLTQLQRDHKPGFAHAYRVERVVIADTGVSHAFVGTAAPEPEDESANETVITAESSVLL